MFIADIPSATPSLTAVEIVAQVNSAQLIVNKIEHILGVCSVINDTADIVPTGDAGTYFSHYVLQDFDFNFNTDGSERSDTSVRIIEQPKHGKLVQENQDATDYTRTFYKYIPDVDFGDYDHFVVEVKAGGNAVLIYYTMSVSLPGEPTYILDENGQKTDDLSRCPKYEWKISSDSMQHGEH